jgi:predicted amidohydrolase YtcJ
LEGLYAAVARRRGRPPAGRPWFPAQRLTVDEALQCFTTEAARICGQDGRRGMIRPGYAADFVVLSRDITSGEPDKMLEARVMMTMVNGLAVHSVL